MGLRPLLVLLTVCTAVMGCSSDSDPSVSPSVSPSASVSGSVSGSASPSASPSASASPSPSPSSSGATRPPYAFSMSRIDEELEARIGFSHRAGCPVPLHDLRFLEMTFVDFDGRVRKGEMVVHTDVAEDVVGVFRSLYEQRFPIERMSLVDLYGGDDDRSMAANNTSAYNCRRVAGADRWSEHAYGRAIDVNPVQNPYVRAGVVAPPAGSRFLVRSPAPGVVTADGPVVRAFRRIGWEWGGEWTSSKDYQHFSESGR